MPGVAGLLIKIYLWVTFNAIPSGNFFGEFYLPAALHTPRFLYLARFSALLFVLHRRKKTRLSGFLVSVVAGYCDSDSGEELRLSS